ncbi:hypothetical protein PIROE2DRAFT_19801 [Piromyces sp. E2]|nr:hypothetical protein PIROE2DRAFT_19801 [Piromyces sp. E2]|eukprot:OUM68751.1 hypothetical protein PIROE2DRAFT_19801 [Piromyces sp. E2]
MNILLNSIYILLFFLSSVILKSLGKDINNVDDFIESINNKEKHIKLIGDILIDDNTVLSITSYNITIEGNSREDTTLRFLNNTDFNILLSPECQYFKIKNINFIGNIQLLDNRNITFVNMTYNGYFRAEHTPFLWK